MTCLAALSITLIAIVAGMLLLAKTHKDNLGIIYKGIAYFVIIVAFLSFIAGICGGLCHLVFGGKGGCSSSEKCQMMSGHGMGGHGSCKMMSQGGMCGNAEMGCGMHGMKKKCKKMCGKEQVSDNEDEDMEDINVEIIQKQVDKDAKPSEPTKK